MDVGRQGPSPYGRLRRVHRGEGGPAARRRPHLAGPCRRQVGAPHADGGAAGAPLACAPQRPRLTALCPPPPCHPAFTFSYAFSNEGAVQTTTAEVASYKERTKVAAEAAAAENARKAAKALVEVQKVRSDIQSVFAFLTVVLRRGICGRPRPSRSRATRTRPSTACTRTTRRTRAGRC